MEIAWNELLDDIFGEQRGFLPGRRPSRAKVLANLGGTVLMDGLTEVQSALLLSVLPDIEPRLYASQLDKGLSGSLVLSGWYSAGSALSARSKQFVFKLGETRKIEREATAIAELVATTIDGVEPPIVRYFRDVGLLVQAYAGLAYGSTVTSLRHAVVETPEPALLIHRLLRARLGRWYFVPEDQSAEFDVAVVMHQYIKKGPANTDEFCPPQWNDYPDWLRRVHAVASPPPELVRDVVCTTAVRSPRTFVHGDLHSQNVLVESDNGECWPIDFAWTHESGTPLVDFAMLECSLKFLAIPAAAELGTLIQLERVYAQEATPSPDVPLMPYSTSVHRVLLAVSAIRHIIVNDMNVDFRDYRKVLFVLTHSLARHPGLNRPFVLASTFLLAQQVAES